MITRIELAIGAIGMTISRPLAVVALPEDVQDLRYLRKYPIPALLDRIGCTQVARTTTSASIMATK
jgi:hypothetical protein